MYNKEYYKKLKEDPEKYRRFREVQNASMRKRKVNNPKTFLSKMFQQAKSRAKEHGLEFNITLDDLMFEDGQLCPILEIPMHFNSGAKHGLDDSPSLDRIDNNLGYIKGNIIIISNRANKIKRDSTLDELKKIVAFLENHKNSQIKYILNDPMNAVLSDSLVLEDETVSFEVDKEKKRATIRIGK